jgi:hypothetical protein
MALPFATRKPAGPAAFEKLQSLIESDFTESTLHFYMNGTKIELPNPNPDWTLLICQVVVKEAAGLAQWCCRLLTPGIKED